MGNLTVQKFGGDAMENATTVGKVLVLLRSDPCFAVFSAPRGVTNLLRDLWKKQESGDVAGATEIWTRIVDRFGEIVSAHCSVDFDLAMLAKQVITTAREFRSADFLMSRGEWLMAQIMASALGWRFVDALDLIMLDDSAKVNMETTKTAIQVGLANLDRAVIPGFYGRSTCGAVKLMPRNTSDVTGAHVAHGAGASSYMIWKKTIVRTADPTLMPSARDVYAISYSQMYEMSDGGAQVIHADAVYPCHRGGVPIEVRDFENPCRAGTKICASPAPTLQSPIVGVAVRKDFCAITVTKHDMQDTPGFMEKLLHVFARRGLSIESAPTGLNAVTVVFRLAGADPEVIKTEIFGILSPGKIESESIEIVTVVGSEVQSGRAHARIFKALGDIPLRGTTQAVRGQSLSIGVPCDRGVEAVCAIHAEFFPVS